MAWTYYCNLDGQTLAADNKEQLADELMEHANRLHGMNMSREEAMQSVDKNAKESAA